MVIYCPLIYVCRLDFLQHCAEGATLLSLFSCCQAAAFGLILDYLMVWECGNFCLHFVTYNYSVSLERLLVCLHPMTQLMIAI